MENKIEIFNNNEFGEIRTVEENGTILFCGSDIAKALGYTNPNKAINDHCRAITKRSTPISGKMQNINFIPEGDVYRLISHSKLPSAEKFEKWIFDEVLPTIRRHGAYMTPDVIEKTLTDPDYIIKLATILKEERTAREMAERKLEEQEPLVHFANRVSDSSNLIDMGKMAKLLKDEKINIGRNRLFEWLRNKGILMKNNVPYQKYIENGYFKIKESVYETPYGSKTNVTTFVTGKGQIYITENLRKEYSIAKQ